ncbi:tagatose-bisphosphate aldolase [Bradyrhizobium japonicum]|uniref:Tagatose-bisphosphate aldolase n=2 Tax=Bradyrhizobium japonicum TaxID=375 RepID=A0A0A3Y1A9_BRAJP|nr:tagatose-bisphosphate aldolase [Bradyrhizobium japonicum]
METLLTTYQDAEKKKVAVGHFNVSDLSALMGVVAAARDLRVPVVIGCSEGERAFLGDKQIYALVASFRDENGIPLHLNADHTHTLEAAIAAAKAGFDSIVFDLSALPIEENIRKTKQAVEVLKGINPSILVEGEIGDIGTGSHIHEIAPDLIDGLTTPEQAKQFVEATGVDILAPAVGNMHGMSLSMIQGRTKKHLEIERIAEIKRATGALITLHGGSGTDDNDFVKAIDAGVNIIHINTELRAVWRRSLDEALLDQPREVIPYKILPVVVDATRRLARSRLKLFNRL